MATLQTFFDLKRYKEKKKIIFGKVMLPYIIDAPLIPVTYNYVLTIENLPAVPGLTADPPCPRVNTWAESTLGGVVGPYLTAAGVYNETYDNVIEANESGVDIFIWKNLQNVDYSYTGTPVISVFDGIGLNEDQRQIQIRYNTPGSYQINLSIDNV